jgi:hypothetical protein
MRLRIPSWLDPRWHEEYQFSTGLGLDAARAALSPSGGRFRSRTSRDGERIRDIRRGGLRPGFVRGTAEFTDVVSQRAVKVSIRRPGLAEVMLTLAVIAVVVWPILNVIVVLVTRGVSDAMDWLVFVVVGPVIYAAVAAVNFAQARYDTNALLRLLGEALAANPVRQA